MDITGPRRVGGSGQDDDGEAVDIDVVSGMDQGSAE